MQLRQLVVTIIDRLFGWGHQRRPHSSDNNGPTGQDNRPQDQQQGSANRGNAQHRSVDQPLRRRPVQQSRVHGIHDASDDEDKDPDGNKYWNGNSTQFDADE